MPVKGAVKGVQDDEDTVLSEFGALGLDCDTRFSAWSDRPEMGERSTILPSSHFGRLVVDLSSKAENTFLNNSFLGQKRRPLRVATLPAFNKLVQAESLSADADVHSRERQTRSAEQLAAQKGEDFTKAMMESILGGLSVTANDPVLVLDFSPHVGDNALAVHSLQKEHANWNLHYLAFDTDGKELMHRIRSH